MKAEDQHMMSILYAPASYAHESHLPEMFRASEIREDTLLNFWLLKHNELCDLPCSWRPGNAMLPVLLSHWHLIPVAAHLIGGYLLRSQLPKQGAVLMSDLRLLAFISLPLFHEVVLDETNSPIDNVSCGAAFILGQFPELPTALYQRFLLHFPVGMAVAQFSAPKTPDHINLLRMAFTYAHHYYS